MEKDPPPAGNEVLISKKTAFDKDLKRISQLERASKRVGLSNLNMGLALLFVMGVWVFTFFKTGSVDGYSVIVIASIVGAYMAMNIGANDVANNVGPAVGSKALTMFGALVIAAIFEAAGALIAGGDVVSTISKSIVNPASFGDSSTFVLAMLSALLAGACWINLATLIGAPVSTTHSIVGGVVGAGIAAAGVSAVDWNVMLTIASSWVISPVLGGVVAAIFLAFIKYSIIYKPDKIAAAKRWIPVLIGIMATAFSIYLIMKGLKKVWKPDAEVMVLIGAGIFTITFFAMRARTRRNALSLENTRKSVASLFRMPLICAAALLSFAHGSNDVANAVGPLAAIVSTVTLGDISAKVTLPLWVLAIGAIGISIGLLLFGPKIIKIVGEKITKLDPVRAFCVALSASITVIFASGLGLPVSSTHVAVGAVFGVGFLREFISNRRFSMNVKVQAPSAGDTEQANAMFLSLWRKSRKRKLVRRRSLTMIIAAWLITVPASAILAGTILLLIQTFQ